MVKFEEWRKNHKQASQSKKLSDGASPTFSEWLSNRDDRTKVDSINKILDSLDSIYNDSYTAHAERYKSGKYDQYSTAGEYSTQLADRRKQWDSLVAQLGDPGKNYKQYFTPQEWEGIQTSVKNQGLDFDRMAAFSEDEQAYFSNWKDEYAWKAYDNAANLDIEKSKKEYADMTKRYDDGDDSITSGQLMVKKLQIRNAEMVQSQIKKAEQESTYMQKYAGFTADQAKAQLQNMEDGDEKFWLEDYVFIKEAKESGLDTTDPLFEKKLYKKYLERMMAAGEERFAKKSERATSSAYQARKEYEDYITSLPADMTDEERNAAIREAQMLLSTKQQEHTEASTEANAANAGYASNHDALLDVTAEITLAEMSEEDRQLLEDYYKSKAIRNDWYAAEVYEKLLASGYTEQQIIDLEAYKSRQENAKVSKAVEDWWRDFSNTNWLTQTFSEAVSFGTNIVSYVTDPITSLVDMMDGSSYMIGDPNRLGYIPGKMTQISRQEFSKWAESWGGDFASTAFKIGESIIDNMGRIAIGGGAGSLILAGTGSFGQTYRNITERGGEKWQAASMGLISGALEVATEKISLDRLIKMKDAGALKGFWRKTLASSTMGAIEVSEEELNFLGQLAAEAVIMADRSNYNVRVQELMGLGLSKEDAEDKATRELLMEAGEIAIESLGSGFGMGMIQSRAVQDAWDSATRNYRTGKAIMQGEGGVEAVKGFAGKVAETASPEMQQKLTQQTAKAQNARQIGKLFNTTIKAINSQTEAQLAENLQRNGLTEKAATNMAKSLVSAVRSGNPVSEAHMDLFMHLAKDMRVKNAVKQTFESEGFKKNMNRVQDFNNKIHKSRYKTTEALAKEATEAGYKISESGRSLEGARIVNTKGGVTLEMDGQQVKAQDIDLKESDAIVVKAISDLGAGVDISNQLLNNYRSTSVAAPDFISHMTVGFELGYAGFGEGGLSNALGKVSPISRQAFELGKQQRTQEEESGKKVKLTDKAAVWYINKDGSVRHIREGGEGQLTTAGQQSTGTKAAHFLQRMGVVGGNVYLFESYETVEKDGKVYQKFRDSNGVEQLAPNGMYRSDTGDIYIDINAGMNAEGITLVTFAHELTHMVQQWSPEKYRVLGDFLAEQYEKEGVDAHAAVKATQARLTALRGSQVSYTEAYHEWMAESMSTLFNDGKIYDKLVALKNKDKGLFNFLKRQIDRLAKLTRKYYEGRLAETAEARFVQRLSPAAIEQLQQKFADALVEAGDNYARAETTKNTAKIRKHGGSNNGRTPANTIRRVSRARSRLGSTDSGFSGSLPPNGNSRFSGVASSSPQSNMEGNNEREGSADGKISSVTDTEILLTQNSDRVKSTLDMGSAVEQTRDLLAFHNISAVQLLDAIDRGGLLMPSLAVTNKNMTDFGDISLVFDKSVIDPQVNAKNRLWGADAWTPSQTELKLNAKFDSKEVSRTVEAMRKSLGQQAAKELLTFTPYQFTQAIRKADGSIFTAYANNIGVQAAYAMEKGLLKQIPMKNGKVDMAALQEQLKDGRVSGSDQGWRSYKAWLTEISDRVIKSYDQATNADILRNMEAQAATGKTFKLSVNGDLVVPAAEYSSIEQLRQNKGRLSQDAATAAKEAGQKLLDFAKQFAKGDITVKAAVDAVNMGFAQRYDVAGIRSTFQNRGISMTQEQATQMQELYKEAVELSTLYFEAKPAGQIGVEQIAVAVVPDSSDMAQVTDALESKGVEVRQYPAGDQQARSEIMRSLDDLKFQDRNRPTGETVADALEGVAGQGDLLTVERYREAYGKLHREEKALLDANAQLRQIETGAVQATQGEIRALRTEANRARRMMAQHQKSLTAVENSIPYKRMTEKLRQQGVTVRRTTDENGISVYSYVDAYAKRKPAAKPAQKVAAPSPDESVGAAPKGFDTLTSMEMEYGNLPEGEKPVRDDTLPKSTDGNDKVSRTARTVKGAKATPDEFVDLLDRKVVEGELSYIPISHNKSTQEAIDYIQNLGWKDALEKWKGEVDKGVSSAKMSAVGALLLNNAAKAGDKDAWLDILHEYQKMGTSAGQAVSAMRILKTLNPDDSLYMINRSVKQMITDMGAEGKNIQINPDLERKYLAAKTDAVRDNVLDEIVKDVARQLPSSFMEKWTAIRYLNMLGNFRTQVRNVTGNIGMALTKKIKDSIAASLETIAYHASGGKFQRTKAVFANRTQLKAAKADFDYVKDLVLGGGKYSDTAAESSAFAQKVQDARKILPIGAEQYRRLTNWAMETGDAVFSKAAYARALAGWLKANGITETDFSKIDPSTMDVARTYAVKEAQEATFRDYNALSSWVSKAGRGKGTPKLIKGISEGIMPFRKTPANILVRAVEYSPMGFVNSVSKSVQAMLGKGDVTGADVVNSWAKTLTGTGLFALGMLLQSVGILVGGPDDDENKDKFESQYGWQNYALVLDDTTITIDFLSPSAIPMFMGAELNKLSQEDGIEVKDIEAALFSIAEPLIEMSMLQGVNDTLDNVQYAESSMGQLLINSALSYLTQGITNTMLGQIERSGEDTRMTTYVDPDSPLPAWLQRQIGKVSAKIPIWDYNQIPYINAWGEEEKNPELIANAAENMFSPSYISTGKNDKVFRELNRLNDVQTKNVYPSTPGRTITYTDTDGVAHKDYALSADEWVALAKKQGQTAHQLVKDMIVSDLYKDLPDAQKGQAITKAYEYARELARQEVLPGYPDDFDAKWMADLKGDIAHGILEHINEESLPSRFKAGDISASEALDLRMQYSNEDEEEAAETVAYWNFQAENPDYDDLSRSHTIKWLEDVQKTGMELEVYYEFCNQYPKLKDEDGKKDKKAIKALIEEIADEENLTYKQKKALKTVAGI